MKRKIAVCALSTSVFLILLSSFYFFLKRPEKVETPKMSEEEKKVIIVRDATYSSEKAGRIDLRLKAKIAKKYMDRSEVDLEGIEGRYISGKEGEIAFKGERGLVDTEKQNAALYGFFGSFLNEYEVKTKSINVDLKTGSISGDEIVVVKGKNLSMVGTGIRGELKEGKFTLLKGVSGTVEIQGEGYEFEASTFTYEKSKQMYSLSGNVVVDKKGMRLKCERMEIYEEEGQPKKVEAKGNVEMDSKGTIAKSHEAVYDFSEKRVVFSGNAWVKREDMELKGNRIVYLVEEGRFFTLSPRMKILRSGS